MNNKQFSQKALNIANNYKTSYLLGGFGHISTKNNLNRLLNQYPENYNWIGKAQEIIGQGFYMDCVGMIKSILWGFSFNLDKSYGGAIYCSNGVPDIDADTMINKCSGVSNNLNNVQVGEAVWMPGHIGIVVSSTQVVECTPIGSCGVQVTNLHGRGWQKHGKLPWVSYSTSSTEKTNVLPPGQSTQVAFAQYFDRNLAGEYVVQTGGYGLNLRKDASTDANVIKAFPDGTHIMNYGYYSIEKDTGVKWLLVAVEGYKGFMSTEYLFR